MRCPSCKADIPEGSKFCLECGAALLGRCPSCGNANPTNAKFCLECGHRLPETGVDGGGGRPRLRERRDRSILQHPIDVQVDVLIVEAEQVFDLRALGNWRRITPNDVPDELVSYPSRPVARHTFRRASRDRLG